METLLIQINDKKANKLLQELEIKNMITVLKKNKEPKQKLSEKYAGILPPKIAKDLQRQLTESRKSW